jgi:sulfotransferase family protein
MSANPYVFIGGCPRSGTTLLQRMLDGHPLLMVTNEANVVPRRAMKSSAGPEFPLTNDLVEQIVGHKYFAVLDVDKQTARGLAATTDTLVAFVGALLDESARRRGKPFAGDKVPEYCRYLPSLHRLFPTARSINIVRDGRDVAAATLDWMTPTRFLGRMALWHEEPVAVCALRWQRQVLEAQRGRDQVGDDRCLEVRYEELVQAPEAVLRSIAGFLDLPFDPAMLEFHKGRTRHDPALESKDRWLPPTAGLRDWRVELSPRDLQLFEALAGGTLAALGYRLATDPTAIAPDVRAAAERCRRWWETEVERRSPARLTERV